MATGNVVLLAAWGAPRDLQAFLAVAVALRRRGLRPILAVPEEHGEPAGAPADIGMLTLPADPRLAHERLAPLQPALVVAHPAALAARALAETKEVPWLAMWLEPPQPPSWWQRLWPGVRDPMCRLRRELGIATGREPSQVLALFPEWFAPAAGLPYPAGTCGFAFHDRPQAMPGDLMDFLDAGAAPIVFTIGGATADDDFFRVSMAAAERLGRRAVLLMGAGATLGTPPSASIGVFASAPFEAVMPRAAVVVHQGGIGITAQALRAGKPMLVVPAHPTQRENARRCVALGVARATDRSFFTPARVAAALAGLLSDSVMRQAAADIGRRTAGENGAACAADRIAHILLAEGLRASG